MTDTCKCVKYHNFNYQRFNAEKTVISDYILPHFLISSVGYVTYFLNVTRYCYFRFSVANYFSVTLKTELAISHAKVPFALHTCACSLYGK